MRSVHKVAEILTRRTVREPRRLLNKSDFEAIDPAKPLVSELNNRQNGIIQQAPSEVSSLTAYPISVS
jgi:hypothetical protein